MGIVVLISRLLSRVMNEDGGMDENGWMAYEGGHEKNEALYVGE